MVISLLFYYFHKDGIDGQDGFVGFAKRSFCGYAFALAGWLTGRLAGSINHGRHGVALR